MHQLNENQKKAIEHIQGPLIIVAGAGTGKTTVITQKIAHIIKNNLAKPEEILALTFTEKAATEMLERVEDLLNDIYINLNIFTFHSFCQKILEQYGLDIGLSNRFKVITQTDAWLLVREHLNIFELNYYRPLANPTRHIHELIKHFNKCKDELISPQQYLEYAEEHNLKKGDMNIEETDRLKEIAVAYHAYNQLLLNKNILDFGDLIFYVVELLKTRSSVSERLKNKFKFILVDEFQDVNWAQYRLLQLLTNQISQLTVVGDDDQSIYAFRGASVSNILHFKEDFPTAQEIVLTENYRSHQQILDAAYELIKNNNPDRLEVKLNIDKKLKSLIKFNPTDNKKAVEYIKCSILEDEVQSVVRLILEIKNNNLDIAWSDFAILVRANNHAEPFCNALQKNNLPYEFLASTGLYRQPVILDCINFLKLIDNYHESTAVYRLLCLPFLKLKENDLQKIIFFAKKKSISYYESLKRVRESRVSEEAVMIVDKLLKAVQEGANQARNTKPSIVLYTFLEKIGYLEYLTCAESQGNSAIIQQIGYLNQFFENIINYENSAIDKAHTLGFLEHYSYLIEAGEEGSLDRNSTVDAVKIMTVHSSKGLEFDYVFIVNLVEDRFPSRRRGESIEIPTELIKEQLPLGDVHYQEERRLFYVALTRAKKKIYLLSSDNYGKIREKKISRFLTEIGYKNPTIQQKNGLSKQKFATSLLTLPQRASSIFEAPKTFSFSQLKCYEVCPHQYRLANIIKIPTKGNASFSFGQTIHSTLQKFYERIQELSSSKQTSLFSPSSKEENKGSIKVPTYEELIGIYNSCWIEDWYVDALQRSRYYEQGKTLLKEFYKANEDKWSIPLTLEGWFKIKLKDYLIHGRIDRIDQLPDGTLEIIDYKTGVSKNKVVGEEKDQLMLYQIAVEQLPAFQHIGKPSKLTFYYLNDNIKVSFLGNSEEIEKLQNKLFEIIQKIHSGNFTATPNPFVCKSCSFRDICEYRIL